MSDRKIEGYYWVWHNGKDWPSWFYGAKVAQEYADLEAKKYPGTTIYYGNLCKLETIILPDKLLREEF